MSGSSGVVATSIASGTANVHAGGQTSTLAAAIVSTTATSITIADTGRFPAGKTILIGTEQLQVVSAEGAVLTVVRGVNGTTAATHLNAAPVVSNSGGVFYGWSLRETTGGGAAFEVVFRDGTSDSAPILAVAKSGAAANSMQFFDGGIGFRNGLFVQKVSGTTEGVVYVG